MQFESRYLVKRPDAAQFLDTARVSSGLNALLGDPARYSASVGPEIVSSQMTVKDAANKVIALVDDPTRTDVQKHLAAKQLAEKVTTHLGKAKKAITNEAEKLKTNALNEANQQLGPRSDRGSLYSEIRDWIREQAKDPANITKIRDAMESNEDVAAVMWHSPAFLLGISNSNHETMRLDALKVHRPSLYADLGSSVGLANLATKFDRAMDQIAIAFYDPEVASQGSKRVEV